MSGSRSEDFAERLSLALKVCNLSRSQLSAALGVHKSLVSRWLSGQVTPTSYNLARISAAFAKLRPGFNMTVWTAPRAEFEAALGLHPASPVADTREGGNAVSIRPPVAASAVQTAPGNGARPSRLWNRIAIVIVGTAIIVLMIASPFLLWHENIGREPTRAAASQSSKILRPATASVAILPFLNMSGDPAKEYLGDGISEEISNDLANTPNLRVAARTSSFSFKGKNADIADIARKLHVTAVLEGSVRQEGSRVRIVAQLINAGDGFHLWSARYDRKLDDLLAVQDEIARSITGALTKTLLAKAAPMPRPGMRSKAQIDPRAYTAYLQGRFFMNRRSTQDLLRAADLFNQAISFEPNYVDAHASLALSYALLFSSGQRRDTLAPAKDQASAALRLDPENFAALLADAQVKRLSWKWSETDAAMQRLLRHYPNSAEAHHFNAVLLEGLGLWRKSVSEQRRAAELDPLAPGYPDNAGQALHFLRRDKEALAEYDRALTLEPNFVQSLGNMCWYDTHNAKLPEAEQILNERLAPLYAGDPNKIMCEANVARNRHDEAELRRIARVAETLYANGALGASWLPFPYIYLGDYETAMGWIEKAYDDRDYGVFYAVMEPDIPASMKTMPRWRALFLRPAFRERNRVRAQIRSRDARK